MQYTLRIDIGTLGGNMRKSKKIQIDIDKLIAKNPAINAEKLARNLEVLQELQRRGIKIGPNYNLESPFSRPTPSTHRTELKGSTFRPASKSL